MISTLLSLCLSSSHRERQSIPDLALPRHVESRPKGFAAGYKPVALTFDDGPLPSTTPLILDALREYGARATFFVLGSNAARHPDLLRRIVDEGHDIGLHSWTHAAKMPMAQAQKEMDDLQRLIEKETGVKSWLFRSPYGMRSSTLAQVAKADGYTNVFWTASAADTATTNPEVVFRNVCFTPNPGEIILMHDVKPHTAAAIPQILAELSRKGFTPIPISQMLREGKLGAQRAASKASNSELSEAKY